MPITDKFSKNMRQDHIEVFEQLSLTKYMNPEAPELKSGACLDYDLVGVIVHCGKTFEGGHYYTYCRRQAAGRCCWSALITSAYAVSVSLHATVVSLTIHSLQPRSCRFWSQTIESTALCESIH